MDHTLWEGGGNSGTSTHPRLLSLHMEKNPKSGIATLSTKTYLVLFSLVNHFKRPATSLRLVVPVVTRKRYTTRFQKT